MTALVEKQKTERNKKLIANYLKGAKIKDLATLYRVSESRVSQILGSNKIMSYPALHEIIIGGKKYIDLFLLEEQIKEVYPLKSHSLRRLARYGRIPHKRIGMSRKDWFNLKDVKHALNLVLEEDETQIDVDADEPSALVQSFDEHLREQAANVDLEVEIEEEDFIGDM